MDIDWSIAGGLIAGAAAGAGARYGRVCSMSAIEDALLGGDARGARAWGLAVGTAGLATMALVALGLVDLGTSQAHAPRLHVLGVVLGGLLFGLGMSLVGTCSFGLAVRAGGGDLRAAVAMLVVGIFAFAVTTGLLAPGRNWLLAYGWWQPSGGRPATIEAALAVVTSAASARGIVVALFAALVGQALLNREMRARPRLVVGAVLLGSAVAAGWLATSLAVSRLEAVRVESLSFVAPTGRALLQVMSVPFRNLGFGVAALAGAIAASLAVAALRRETRWEAFDDAREMRRHLTGAALMGMGGVLAQGCTVGQGLTAASAFAISAPLFVLSLVAGAWLGLRHLVEGVALWRMGFSTRAD